VTVANEGTYTVNPSTGVVTFDPLPTFSGTATPIYYQVTDTLNRNVTSTITVTVAPSLNPVANPDVTSNMMNVTQTVNPVTNDVPAASGSPLQQTSVKICLSTDTLPTCTGTTLTVQSQGTYSVDGVTGIISFVPLSTFVGVATPISYMVTDADGYKATSTYTPTVVGAPTATPDVTTGLKNSSQSINVVTNSAGTSDIAAAGTTILSTSVTMACTQNIAPLVCTVGANGEITIETQGTYTLNAATGVITFTPVTDYVGTAAPVTYTVADAFGQTATTTYTPTIVDPPVVPVILPPVATPDTKTVNPGASVTFTNITGDKGLASGERLITEGGGRTCLIDPETTLCSKTNRVVIKGEGVFVLDPATGLVIYTADRNATPGTKTSITYKVTDMIGQSATSTLTPLIPVPAIKIVDDVNKGAYDRNQIIDPIKNDKPGASAVPLDRTSLRLCGVSEPKPANNDAANVSPSCSSTEVVTADGKYTLDIKTGLVTFDPNEGFTGLVTQPIYYQIADMSGRIAFAKITPFVGPKGEELAYTGVELPWMIALMAVLLTAGGVTRRQILKTMKP
jgi:CshA-type fibril repeat protein